MGKVITSDNTIKRLTELERQRCCNRNQFLPTFDDFPTTGEDNVLYIDKEKSKIYLWNGSIYITADDLVGHTNIVATTTYDSLNPLTGWVAPTTPYFGNTATVLFTDDIIVNFTFNGTIWEEKIIDDTAISGIKTSKTVYVDGTYGDDTTGQRESRDFPFQTLDAAIAVCEAGDLLKVFPGDYTQTVSIPVIVNIDCDNGVNWLLDVSTFMNTTLFAVDLNVKWNFYKLYGTVARTVTLRNSLGSLEINAYEFNLINCINNVKKEYIKVNNLINSQYTPRTLLADGTEVGWMSTIENVERTLSQGYVNFAPQGKDLSKGTVYIKNLKSINSAAGYGNVPTMGYYYSNDAGINKQYTTTIDNVTHDDPNIYITPFGPLDTSTTWRGVTVGTQNGLLSSNSQYRTGGTFNLDIRNIKSTGHGIRIGSNTTGDNITVNVKIKGVFEKGIPIYTHNLGSITNSKIIIDLDLECHTSMGLFIGFADGASADNNIGATNQIIVTGRIKTRYAGMSCISIGTGSGASNNTNGTILLKDLTLINDGTVSPIMCAVAENVLIQNVVTNSLVVDANITEVGQSIIRNTNYK